MTTQLKRVAFIIEEFALNSPGQQMLDRFLMGYPHEGEFRRLHECKIAVHVVTNPNEPEVQRRVKDFGLLTESTVAACVHDADAVVVVPRTVIGPRAKLIRSALQSVPVGARCFVYGALAETLEEAKEIAKLAEMRQCPIASGTATAAASRLPERTLPPSDPVRALVVVQGEYPLAEMEALEAMLPLVARHSNVEKDAVEKVELFRGADVWTALDGSLAPLLASAISRSDTPQGDPVADGRTQDIVGLGLLPKLAKAPRCWILRHAGGLHSAVAVLDGVIADYNVAVEAASGQVLSWQSYRPPAPAHHVYSRLVGVVEEFFRTGVRPWPITRSLLAAQIMDELGHFGM